MISSRCCRLILRGLGELDGGKGGEVGKRSGMTGGRRAFAGDDCLVEQAET